MRKETNMKQKGKILMSAVCVLASAATIYSVSINSINMQKKMDKQNDFSEQSQLLFTNENEENQDSAQGFKDGVYEAEAEGFGGIVRVSVTIKEGKIDGIEVLSHTETPEYYEKAIAVIPAMIEQNTVNVDSVSGATITSNALREAVLKALLKAGKSSEKKESNDLMQLEKELQQLEEKKKEKDDKIKNLSAKENRPSVAGSASVQTSGLKDGTYIGTGTGWRGPITVQITVQNQTLTNITLLGHSDDSPYIDRAMSVISSILSSGGGSISTVSGATYSSRGIIDAVQNALSQAQGGTVAPLQQEQRPELPNIPPHGSHDNTWEPEEDPKGDTIFPDNGGEPAIPEELKPFFLKDKMQDGEYIGYAVGYHKSGTIKTIVTIQNGEVVDVKVPEYRPEYPDDFWEPAVRIAKYMRGPKARKIAAISLLYSKYTDEISNSSNPSQMVVDLLGEQYAHFLDGLNPNSTAFYRETVISKAIKNYLGDKYEVNDLFDAVSSATISASGIGKSVENAMQKAANDAKVNNEIKETIVSAPEKKFIYANWAKPLDLSKLQVTLVKKDGTETKLAAKDFAANGLEMVDDESGAIITEGMSLDQFKDKQIIKVRVNHKNSLTWGTFNIQFGNYSDDYVNRIEYSLDGKTWYLVDKVEMDPEHPENISYIKQTINAPTNFRYKSVKVRVVSQSGQKYEYETDKKAGSGSYLLYHVLDTKDNSNVPNRLFIYYTFSGTEADKTKVPDSSKPQPEKPEKPEKPDGGDLNGKEEILVNDSVIAINIGYDDIVENKAIKPIKVTLFDKTATLLNEIENLPKGMTFDGKQIAGVPEVADDEWDKQYNDMHKIIVLRIKAETPDAILVREQKICIRRDRDHDGILDYEEEKAFDVFNAILTDRNPIEVDGTAPTLETYKAKIKNLPEKGVEVVIVKEPDFSKPQTEVTLGFNVAGMKQGTVTIPMTVKKAPEASKEEIEVNGSVIAVNIGYDDIVENKPINPIKVTLFDKTATLLNEIENLPKGMTFDGKQIAGVPEVADDEWDKQYNDMHKIIVLRIKAETPDAILVREQKICIRRDRDHDGILDYEEEKAFDVFNAILTDRNPIEVDGTAPTLETYKAKIKNLPEKGVEVVIVKEPDFSKPQTEVTLGFNVAGMKQGTVTIPMTVKKQP